MWLLGGGNALPAADDAAKASVPAAVFGQKHQPAGRPTDIAAAVEIRPQFDAGDSSAAALMLETDLTAKDLDIGEPQGTEP